MKNSKRRRLGGKQQVFSNSVPLKRQGDRIWLYGKHAVTAALANPDREKHRLAITSADHILYTGDVQTEILERQELETILPKNAVHQGVALQVSPLQEPDLKQIISQTGEESVIVALDQASDPQNIGAVLRSAAAFGADAVIVQNRHTPEATAALAKAASGALEQVPFVRVTNLARSMKQLKDAEYWCAGMTADGTQTLVDANLSGRTVLALGAEGEGLRRLTRENCDFLIRIPIINNIDNLNLAATAAISLYEIRRASL